MAVIGDVLVKLVADFGEFASGMKQSVEQLDGFAKKTAETNERIAGFFSQLQALTKTAIGVAVINELRKFTEETVKHALEVEKLAQTYKLTSEQVQGIQAQAKATGQSFDELAKYYQKHGEQLDRVADAAKLTGQTMSGSLTGAIRNVADEM